MHPGLQKIEEWINQDKLGKIYSVQVDLGEYLPDWHPWEDYRQSYAARADQGGGVVLTLIHELDYLHWLFGKPKDRLCHRGTSNFSRSHSGRYCAHHF